MYDNIPNFITHVQYLPTTQHLCICVYTFHRWWFSISKLCNKCLRLNCVLARGSTYRACSQDSIAIWDPKQKHSLASNGPCYLVRCPESPLPVPLMLQKARSLAQPAELG